jgi:type IV secretion system protein VirB2
MMNKARPIKPDFGNRMFCLPQGLIVFFRALANPRIALHIAWAGLLIAGPQFAHAEPWDEGADSIVEALRTIIRPIAIIAIIVCGLLALVGKMAWGTVGMVAGGIFITVGSDAIYDFFSDAIG